MFDRVIVVVMKNADKVSTFTVEERLEMIRRSVGDIPNVEIDSYDGLLADYARIHNARVIVKGLRAVSDFEYEFQMALTNKKLNQDTETLFLTTSAEYMYLSSSMVKLIGSMGGKIRDFVPEAIHDFIISRLNGKGTK